MALYNFVKNFRKVVRVLRLKCPADRPIYVRRTKVPRDCEGDCNYKQDHYLIRIDRALPEYAAIEILMHEWGHVLSWKKCSKDEHCNEWGKAYSKVYRAFLKEFLDDDE